MRHIDVQNPTTIIAENDEYIQDLEAGSWHSEEIERDEVFGMILQECSPVP